MLNKLYIKFRYWVFVFVFYTLNPKALFRRIKQNLSVKKILPPDLGFRNNKKISILILTFNALDYVEKCLDSLNKFRGNNVEMIVVDNNSNESVKNYLRQQLEKRKIDKLLLSEENTYFAKGNNIAASMSSADSTHLLLLNSDVEILHKDWLDILLTNAPKRGIISFGKFDIPVLRPDGWCFLIDKKTYFEFSGINEYYKMNWGLTELTGKVARAGYGVKCITNYGKYIIHYGQRSYVPATNKAKFNKMSNVEVIRLFNGVIIDLLKG